MRKMSSFFRNRSVYEFYRLKALITLEQLAEYFSPNQWVGKKKNLYEQNFDGEANWPSVVNFHCMQIECCDKHADYFRRWLKQGAKFFTFS